MPKGAIYQGVWNEQKGEYCKTTGLAAPDRKMIWLYVEKGATFDDLFSTISHELGHIVESRFKKNPPHKPRYNKKHEQKANHYENFACNALKLTRLVKKHVQK